MTNSPFDMDRPAGSDFASSAKFQLADQASQRRPMMIGDLAIRIDRDGTWYYHGSPIRRKELVFLFASALRRDEAGAYWLVTPAEMGRIQVDDVPFIAVEMVAAGCGVDQIISLRTNIDQIITVDQNHPITVVESSGSGGPVPYVEIGGGLQARLTRSVYYDLVGRGVEHPMDEGNLFGVWSAGCFFPLGKLDGSV
jgi:hypothetical protein